VGAFLTGATMSHSDVSLDEGSLRVAESGLPARSAERNTPVGRQLTLTWA
jgi:hypothetical protein